MNPVQRLAKNTVVLICSDIICKVLGFFYVTYTVRDLGATAFGILSFAIAFTGIFGVLTDIGLEQLTIREVARDKSIGKKYVANIIVMKTILGICTFGLIALTVNLLDYPEQTTKVVYFVGLSVISGAFRRIFDSTFQAFERMEILSVGRILNSILLLSGALLAIKQNLDLVGFAFLLFMISMISLGYSFFVSAWKFVLPKIELDWAFWQLTIKEVLPFGLSAFFAIVYVYIGSVMLSLIQGDKAVGFYNAALRLVQILCILPGTYFVSVLPILSRLFKNSQDSLIFAYERSLKYMIILSVPISVGITLLADKIILLIYGSEFAASVIVLQILIWSNVFISVSLSLAHLLRATNQQILDTKVTGLGMVANVVLNLLLIPRYSYIGACIATVITELIVLLLLIVMVWKTQYKLTSSITLLGVSKIIISSTIMALVIIYLNHISMFLLIGLSAVIYFLSVWCMKGFDRKDRSMFEMLLNHKSHHFKNKS